VRNFVEALGGVPADLTRARVACIGPITADTARELGFADPLVARDSTIAGLVQTLVEDARARAASA